MDNFFHKMNFTPPGWKPLSTRPNEEPVEEPVEEEPPLPKPPSPPPPPPVEEPVEEEPPTEQPKKKKKTTLFIILGVVAIATIIGIALVINNKVDIPTPPYFDENGEIDWDKKFELDSR